MARQIIDTGPDRDVIYEEENAIRYAETYSPVARVVWFVLGLVNTLLALRFLLRLFGANPAAGFTDFVYSITAPLVDPFANVIRSTAFTTGIVEWSTLLAMAIYWLIAYAVVKLVTMARNRPVARY